MENVIYSIYVFKSIVIEKIERKKIEMILTSNLATQVSCCTHLLHVVCKVPLLAHVVQLTTIDLTCSHIAKGVLNKLKKIENHACEDQMQVFASV